MKVAAGETLDEALATLAGNFSSSNQYFDLLVQVDKPSILCIKCNQDDVHNYFRCSLDKWVVGNSHTWQTFTSSSPHWVVDLRTR